MVIGRRGLGQRIMGIESAYLQLMLTPGLGDRKLSQLLERLGSRGISVDEFVRYFDLELCKEVGVSTEIAQSIHLQRDDAIKLWEELEEKGVQMLLKMQPGYPERLRHVLADKAPPVLFAFGNTGILERGSVAICGSRKASEAGIKIAGDAAAACAEYNLNVVSGYANGVDLAAHEGALEVGGATTLVLAEGIMNFKLKPAIEAWAGSQKLLVLSEFAPRTRWFANNAMKRNATVCGLSDAVIVVETGMSGGTFDAAETALRLHLPLFVVEFANPSPAAEGNAYFLQRNAKPIRRLPNGSPNLETIWESIGSNPKESFEFLQASLGLN